MSGLTGERDIFIEDRLFATLDPLTREVDVGEASVLVTDTVGFIRKLPHHLVASFRATLEETAEADLLLHVIDASQATWEEQRVVVEQVLEELGVGDRPRLLVFNKIDLLPEEDLLTLQERIGRLVKNAIFVSAVQEAGLECLAPLGRFVSYNAAGVAVDVNQLRFQAKTIIGFAMAHFASRRPDVYARHREELWKLCAGGQVRPAIHCTLPLERAAEGHRIIESRENLGKVVLTPAA